MARDISIDILRCIALIGIVVIHCEPESLWLRQIRNFDVPLMVFLSGVSYTLSIKDENTLIDGGYLKYVIKRFKRLILYIVFCSRSSLINGSIINLYYETLFSIRAGMFGS